MAKVYIGVGHGGKDPGAVSNGFLEKTLVLDIAKACQMKLDAYGVETKLSRTTDIDFPTQMKVQDANARKADWVLDIHLNAGKGVGTEVYYSVTGGASQTLAQNVQDSIVSSCNTVNRGIKTKVGTNGDYFGIIRDTKAPAVLVECCFIDSADIEKVRTPQGSRAFGEAVASGVLKTLGLTEPISRTYRVVFPNVSTQGECESIIAWVRSNAPYIGKIEEEE